MRPWITLARKRPALQDERGIALVMSLGILFVLTISVGTVIYVTSASARHAEHSNAGQKAYALAEAGVHDAFAVLNSAYPNDPAVTGQPWPGNWCLLHPQPIAPEAGAVVTSFPGAKTGSLNDVPCGGAPFSVAPDSGKPNETVTWWGRIRHVENMGLTWVIRSIGNVPNPTGPGASPVTRTITVKVPVVMPEGQNVPPGILDWVYSAKDMTLDQHVDMRSPLFVDGNLTLHSNKPEIYGRLHVMGNLTLDSSADQFAIKETANIAVGGMTTHSKGIGASNKRVSEAHLQGGCQGHATCGWDADDVYVDPAKRDQIMPPRPVTAPPVDWSFWYQASSPGPTWNCDAATKSGPVPSFDNNSTLDLAIGGSVPTVVDLTPGTSYTCKTIAGELSWNAATNKLTVKGTIFIDGSATVTDREATYGPDNHGVIYMSGTFILDNHGHLCAISCTTTDGWDPNDTALVIVANGTAGNDSIQVKTADFQGALIGTYGVTVETTANAVGPLVSLTGSVYPGQGGDFLFPPVNFAPTGTPGNPPPPSILLEPREFEGG
jgi:hypothetical protein